MYNRLSLLFEENGMNKFVGGLLLVLCACEAMALEYPIGKPVIENGMEIGAVYLQAVEMEPSGMMLDANHADIHLEADIHATQHNNNGFAEGDWIPYLMIHYKIQKINSKDKAIEGMLMPMVANDGPHYGDNVKLNGPGKYDLTYTIMPPSAAKPVEFGRHTDKETGVAPWFNPFEIHYLFTFAGVGKKGGY